MQQLDGLKLVGGMLLGWPGSWILCVVAFAAYYGTVDDDGFRQSVGLVIGLVALFLIPVATGATLIMRGRPRLGSGMLLGVTLGSLIGAGVCTSFITVAG